ncbi:MAG: hypothetical protein E7021_05180 [Alphaproteobacteria bacterium]|nr:hypothetical protein [Alphaproteobacteria bacterium]
MWTIDKFLGGKVLLKQSKSGLRATSDAVLLSAFVKIKENETLLDVGAGNGVVGLCINARKKCKLNALECQTSLIKQIQENAELNKTDIHIFEHNLFDKKDILKGILFHHIVTNPPFYDNTGKGRKNDEQKLAFQAEFDLKKWLDYCLKHLKSKGSFTMIHRPELLGEILYVLEKKLGKIEIFPIQTKQNQPATRIILRGVLGAKSPLKLYPPLVMHKTDGSRSELAEQILRNGKEM